MPEEIKSERAYVVRGIKEVKGSKRALTTVGMKPTLNETVDYIKDLLISGETKLEVFEEDRFLRDEWGENVQIHGDRGNRYVKPLSGSQGAQKKE